MEQTDWENLPPTTVPESAQLRVCGFDNVDAAEKLGRVVGDYIKIIGSFIDLSLLEGVTIAIEYDEALASIDQGVDGARPLDRTNTEKLQGIAKTCQVRRDEITKSHIVFNAAMLVPLIAVDQTTQAERQEAMGLIAHECGHVEINKQLEAMVPDARLGAEIEDFERAVLFQIANVLWDEYAVCRLTWRFAPLQNAQHAESVVAVTAGARSRANEKIKAYRVHGDHLRILSEAGSELCQPIKMIAYLIGGMDGEESDWDAFPDARSTVDAEGYGEFADRLREDCRRLWDSRAHWDSKDDILAPLLDLTRDILSSAGLHLRLDTAGGWHLHLPMTPETIPDSD